MNDNVRVIIFQILHKIEAKESEIWNRFLSALEDKYFGDSLVEVNNCIVGVFS